MTTTKMVKKDKTLAFRVPCVDPKNEGLIKNLGFLLSVICDCLGCDSSLVKLQRDEKLGTEFNLSAKVQGCLQLMQASLTIPQSGGVATEFETGLKASLPEMLAALKVARRNSNLVYKSPKVLKAKITPVSSEMLRKTVNMKFGFDERNSDPFVASLLKEFLNELTKPLVQNLPGVYMHSLKTRNKAQSDQALLHLMGYVPCSPGANKILHTILHKTKEVETKVAPKAAKGTTVIGKGTSVIALKVFALNADKAHPEETDFREFRTGVVCTLPYINPKSTKPIKDQITNQSLEVRELGTLSFWKKNEELAEAVYLAYAIKLAIDKKSKAQPKHFKNAREHLINLSANQVFQDASGTIYQKYSDIPLNIRGWLETTYFHKTKVGEASSVRTEKDDKPEVKKEPLIETSETSVPDVIEKSSPVEEDLTHPVDNGGVSSKSYTFEEERDLYLTTGSWPRVTGYEPDELDITKRLSIAQGVTPFVITKTDISGEISRLMSTRW